MAYSFVEYMDAGEAELFTAVTLPRRKGAFPTVIYRSPYVDFLRDISDGELAERTAADHKRWNDAGYAVVVQHCRGRGKSSGDCIPYLNERRDGLGLQEWVRKQPFYNGEIYLVGCSYTSSVHLVTAPFAEDIKGAVIMVQDSDRYNCNYRNGFFKVGLHGEWYVNMYKAKSMPQKIIPWIPTECSPCPIFRERYSVRRFPILKESLQIPRNHPPSGTHTSAVWNQRMR